MRSEVISSSPLKFLQQIGSPIGSVVFETVAEYRIRRMVAKCFDQAVSDRVEVGLNGSLVVMIEDKSFCADRRTLHGHSGSTGDKEDRHPKRAEFPGNLQTTVFDHRILDLLCIAEPGSLA